MRTWTSFLIVLLFGVEQILCNYLLVELEDELAMDPRGIIGQDPTDLRQGRPKLIGEDEEEAAAPPRPKEGMPNRKPELIGDDDSGESTVTATNLLDYRILGSKKTGRKYPRHPNKVDGNAGFRRKMESSEASFIQSDTSVADIDLKPCCEKKGVPKKCSHICDAGNLAKLDDGKDYSEKSDKVVDDDACQKKKYKKKGKKCWKEAGKPNAPGGSKWFWGYAWRGFGWGGWGWGYNPYYWG